MAQLSEKLVRAAIACIRTERKLMLTINEVDQALHAWLTLHGHEQRPSLETAPDAEPCNCNYPNAWHCKNGMSMRACTCVCHGQG